MSNIPEDYAIHVVEKKNAHRSANTDLIQTTNSSNIPAL